MINWCMRLYMRIIEKRSDDVTKTKFVKSRDDSTYMSPPICNNRVIFILFQGLR